MSSQLSEDWLTASYKSLQEGFKVCMCVLVKESDACVCVCLSVLSLVVLLVKKDLKWFELFFCFIDW